MKNDGKLSRNWLKGAHGDAHNAILCAIGQNFRKLLSKAVKKAANPYITQNFINFSLLL